MSNLSVKKLFVPPILFLPAIFLAAALSACPAYSYQQPSQKDAKPKQPPASGDAEAKKSKPEKTAYDYNLPGSDGKDVPLSSYKGKYILIVNLGRKSSYSDQLPGLVKLYDTYKDKGLVVIGVPSNDFGASEPGTGAEIQKVYADAKVPFPVMAVSKLTGNQKLPLYQFLTASEGAPDAGPVHWNYTKFLVDKNGKIIARLDPDVAPDSHEMISTIQEVLDGRFKPKKKDAKGPGKPSDDGKDDE